MRSKVKRFKWRYLMDTYFLLAFLSGDVNYASALSATLAWKITLSEVSSPDTVDNMLLELYGIVLAVWR